MIMAGEYQDDCSMNNSFDKNIKLLRFLKNKNANLSLDL